MCMPQALNSIIHQKPHPNRNPFKPHFEDEELEEAWQFQRIIFQKGKSACCCSIIVINIIF